MNRTLFIISLLFVATLVAACSDSNLKSALTFEGPTMGTQYHITLVTPKKLHTDIDALKLHVDTLLKNVNQQMSTYIPSSEISQFNLTKQQEWFAVSSDFAHVVSNAQRISKLSNGAFDITVSPLINLWGFGKKTQLTPPTDQQIADALHNVGYQLLEVRLSPPALRKRNKNLQIDLSAIAKGFAVDKISSYLTQKGYTDYLVEIGGEIHLQGTNQSGKPWRVGIESPNLKKSNEGHSLLLSNLSLATSGDYRNYFIKDGVRFSHTINPTTGKAITHSLASVTLLHESTMIADALATTLMVLGDTKGKAFIADNKFRANMIIRNKSTYHVWQNIDALKIPQTSQKCPQQEGCAYLE